MKRVRPKQKVQLVAAQFSSGENKERPPLTMEPSIDDPLAAVKLIMRQAHLCVNNSVAHGGELF
jgi:hypothetical protein